MDSSENRRIGFLCAGIPIIDDTKKLRKNFAVECSHRREEYAIMILRTVS